MSARSPRTGSSPPTSTRPIPSPYQVALPRDAEVEDDPLELRLDFHRECVVLHDYAKEVARVRFVSALDVAHALARELDLSTGLLPPETLWWARTASGSRVAIWCEPRAWTVRLRATFAAKPRRMKLPMPGLIFVCLTAGGRHGVAPYVFAATARPRSAEAPLFHAPCYNVFDNGRVCPGTHVFPADPARLPEDFFRSYFSPAGGTGQGKSRRHPDDVGRLWAELAGQVAYPIEDLVPQCTVADAMRLGE